MNHLLQQHFELNRGGKSHLTAMEGMRGLAAMVVFLVHFESMFRPWVSTFITNHLLTHSLVNIGHIGVDVFFVLSGYLIYGSLTKLKPFSISSYTKARVKRLYPAFIAIFLITWLGHSLGLGNNNPIPESNFEAVQYILANLTLNPYIFGHEPMVDVAWTLAYEVTFYTLAPLAMVGLGMRKLSSNVRQLFLFSMFLVGATLLYDKAGPVKGGLFFVGAILYEWQKVKGVKGTKGMFTTGLVIMSISVLGFSLGIWSSRIQLLGIMMGSLLFVWGGLHVKSFLTWTPLRYIGNMSYSYYLSHSVSLQIGVIVLGFIYPPNGEGEWGTFFLLAAGMFLFTLLGSAVLFILIEKPISLSKKQSKTTKLW
jgi:exopolysaccharide production protein ExoZ